MMLLIRRATVGHSMLFTAVRHYSAPRRQPRLTLSKKRQAMEKKQYCLPGPSVPLCIMIMLFATYNIYATCKVEMHMLRRSKTDPVSATSGSAIRDSHLCRNAIPLQRFRARKTNITTSDHGPRSCTYTAAGRLAMLSRLRRKVYLFLTTSERDARNRKDYVMTDQQLLRRERDRIHRTNDVFHEAGHKGQLTSFEALTLQFRDMAWSFLIIPSLFAAGVVLLIFFTGRQERAASLRESQAAYTQRLADATAKREALSAQLLAKQQLHEEQVRRSKDDEALDAEIEHLASQINALTTFKKGTLASKADDR